MNTDAAIAALNTLSEAFPQTDEGNRQHSNAHAFILGCLVVTAPKQVVAAVLMAMEHYRSLGMIK